MSTNVVVPELGESIVEARVAKWLKKEGDRVSMGEPLVELETEKIDLEVSADREGVLSAIKHGEGDDVKVGEVLATLDTAPAVSRPTASPATAAPANPPSLAQDSRASFGVAGRTEPAASASARGESPASYGETSPKRPEIQGRAGGPRAPDAPSAPDVRATPTARNVAKEQGVKLESVQPSGAAGRVMKQDVLKLKAPAPEQPSTTSAPPARSASARSESQASYGETSPKRPAPESREGGPDRPDPPSPADFAPGFGEAGRPDRSEERVRMTKRRQTIARRLVEAQHNAAMLTTFNEVDMSAVMALRERRKDAFQKLHGVGLGIASFFVKAAIGALKAFPQLNAEIQGDEIVLKRYYDIGMAVGAEGGLVVPVIRDADRLNFAEIELAIRDFAKRAQDGTLTLEDLKGGTFTITNGGVFGSLMSTPILNPPQVGILGLHKIAERPVAINGQVAIRQMMYLALSYDHRIVDGREAVQFLVKIKEYIEDPAWMLLDS